MTNASTNEGANEQGKPLESLKERQLTRGLNTDEINWFMAHRGQVPLCDSHVAVENGIPTCRCALYGPLCVDKFIETCLRCQKEIHETIMEEERLYRKLLYGYSRV